jgi:hypothetical protein
MVEFRAGGIFIRATTLQREMRDPDWPSLPDR